LLYLLLLYLQLLYLCLALRVLLPTTFVAICLPCYLHCLLSFHFRAHTRPLRLARTSIASIISIASITNITNSIGGTSFSVTVDSPARNKAHAYVRRGIDQVGAVYPKHRATLDRAAVRREPLNRVGWDEDKGVPVERYELLSVETHRQFHLLRQ
jgi:hypothetical protein